RACQAPQLHLGRDASLRRDRGHHHRGHRGGDQRPAEQDRLALAQRPHPQVQPALANRGGSRRFGALSGPRRVLQHPPLTGPTEGLAVKLLGIVLASLLALVQYPLWLGEGSWLRVWELDRQLSLQQEVNAGKRMRNEG